MFLTRLWFIIVALIGAVALVVAFVAPRSASRQLAHVEARGLDRAQYAAEQMLKNDARRWIDYVFKLGRDARLTEALESFEREQGDPRMLHETVRSWLGSQVRDPGALGISVLGAVTATGVVVARIGEHENDYGDSLAREDVIEDALNGYMSDSVWARGETLTRVASAPVLSKDRQSIIGAVFVGIETGARLAAVWKRNLGVDVAFLQSGQTITSTHPAGAPESLARQVTEQDDLIRQTGRTNALSLSLDGDKYVAVAAPFAGEAKETGGVYVLLQKSAVMDTPWALLGSSTKDDLSWAGFPWLSLALAIVLMIGGGLFLQIFEITKPLALLRQELQSLARGDVSKLDDARHPGRYGGLARDVNAAIERFSHREEGPHADKDISSILSGSADRERLASLPPLPPLGGPAAAWGGAAPASGPGNPNTPGTSSALGNPGGTPGAVQPFAGPDSMGAIPASNLKSPPLPGTPLPTPPSQGTETAEVLSPDDLLDEEATPVPEPNSAAERPSQTAPQSDITSSGQNPAPTEPERAPEHEDTREDWLAHVREVFAAYLEMRKTCGESVDSLTLESFQKKLEQNRKAIMDRYSAKGARFAVYAKGNKAALRATPVR